MDKLIWQFFNELYDTACNPNVNEAEVHDQWSNNSVVNRNEPLLILQATNFESTDRYKILAQSASKKPKANVLRKWYESSKIKITKISCGIWVKSGKTRCILNAFTRNHFKPAKNDQRLPKYLTNLIWRPKFRHEIFDTFSTQISYYCCTHISTVTSLFSDVRDRCHMCQGRSKTHHWYSLTSTFFTDIDESVRSVGSANKTEDCCI